MTKILKDTREFDSKGNLITYRTPVYKPMVDEPYDPAYLTDEVEIGESLYSGERKYIRMVRRLERALRRARVPFSWDGANFVITNMVTGYPNYRYVYVTDDDTQFGYGTFEKELIVSDTPDEVVAKAVRHYNSEGLVKI